MNGSDYDKDFDPKIYLEKSRYNKIRTGTGLSTLLENYYYDQLHKVMDFDQINGEWLLDIGTGPCLYTSYPSSKKFKNIVLSDYCEANRLELVKSLTRDPDAHDWSNILNYYSELENKSPKEIEDRTISAVKAVVPIDALSKTPLGCSWFAKFDCLLSALCLEGVGDKKFEDKVRDFTPLLKPGGFFIVTGVSGCSIYHVGNKPFKWQTVTLAELVESFQKNGYDIVYENELKNDFKENKPIHEYSDYDSRIIVVAQLRK